MIKDIIKNKYEIILRENFVHIKQYSTIIDIDNNLIKIRIDNNTDIAISGNHIIICAMDEYEIVIKGQVKSIDYINEQS